MQVNIHRHILLFLSMNFNVLTNKVSQVSVHNALKKAAFQTADLLIQRLSQ